MFASLLRRTILCLCLLTFTFCQSAQAQKVDSLLPLMQALVQDYQSYGLPFPAKKAQLSLLESPTWNYRSPAQKNWGTTSVVVFALPRKHPHEPEYIYYNAQITRKESVIQTEDWQLHPTKPSVIAHKYIDPTRQSLDAAIACYQRGWKELSLLLLRCCMEENHEDVRHRLIDLAWDYWVSALSKPEFDWSVISQHLNRLAQTPYLKNDHGKYAIVPRSQDALNKIGQACSKKRKVTGKTEMLLESLIDTRPDNIIGGQSFMSRSDSFPASYKTLWKQGFDAIPALLKHFNDDRVTHCTSSWLRVYSISDIVKRLLYEFSQKRLDKEQTLAWWRDAQQTGEEDYLLQNVQLPDYNNTIRYNSHMLHLIAWKYPKHLSSLYERQLSYPKSYPHEITDLLVSSRLPYQLKGEILLRGTKVKDSQQRLRAFFALIALKHPHTTSRLLEWMQEVPSNTKWDRMDCPASPPTQIARYLDNPKAWDGLEALARRSSVDQRKEILEVTDYVGTSGEKKRHALLFMSRFLNDTSVSGTDKQSIQNMVALTIGYHLGIRGWPDASWDEKIWAELHVKVKQAINRLKRG